MSEQNNTEIDFDNIIIDKGNPMIVEPEPEIKLDVAPPELEKEKVKFVPPARTKTFEAADKAVKAAATISPEKEKETLDERIKTLETVLKTLKSEAGRDGVRVVKASKGAKEIDFSKISEDSVYDLNVPIEVVEHQIPDLAKVVLKDSNYICRYINMNPGRLGPMKAAGFTYVVKEDIESITLDLEPNENGQYVYVDVVLMKCSKAKYFGALRGNFLRAQAATNPKLLHKQMQQQTTQAIMDMPDPKTGLSHKRDAQKYMKDGHLEVYI